MRKIKLDLDQLNVETFSTTGRETLERGTVRGNVDVWTNNDHELCGNGNETDSGPVACECQPITYGGDTCYFCDSEMCELQTMETCPDICA